MDGTLIRPFNITVPSRHAYYLVSRQELSDTPLVSAFATWLSEYVE